MINDLALIILNYNSADDTITCVRKLIEFEEPYHIIVVDNQSTDNSLMKITTAVGMNKNIDIIQSKSNGGYSAGNNRGIRFAKEKYNVRYVAILNPDVLIPDINVFTRLLDVLERNERVAVIGASIVNAENEYNPNLSCWNIPSPKDLVLDQFLLNKRKFKSRNFKLIEKAVAQVECVAGCFFIARLESLENVGLLDENVFLYNEENILGIKLKEAGYIEAVALGVFYIHNHKYARTVDVSFKKKIQTTSNGYRSRKYLCSKYYSKRCLPFLWCVEQLNKCYLVGAYFKNKIVDWRK